MMTQTIGWGLASAMLAMVLGVASPGVVGIAGHEGVEVMDLSELAKALLTQDLSVLEAMIREAAEGAGIDRIENMLQVGFFSRRTTEQMGMEGALGELEGLAVSIAPGSGFWHSR